MKYKVGDWVKITKDFYVPERIGKYGRIVEIDGNALKYKYILADMPLPHMGGQSEEELSPCCQHGKVEGELCVGCNASVHPSKNFKVGDRVRVVSVNIGNTDTVGEVGTITEIDDTYEYPYRVEVKNGAGIWSTVEKIEEPETQKLYFSNLPSNYWMGVDWFVTSTPRKESFMQKLSTLPQAIRRAFDKDQKALYRAGYIDQHGEWTEKALNEAEDDVAKAYLKDNRSEYVARAEEMIELSKEEDCE